MTAIVDSAEASAPVLIMGAPYVFARQKLRKPFHAEVVTLLQRPVLCHNACGLYYIPTVEQCSAATTDEIACPDCHASPKAHRIGDEEPIEVTVRMQFGNVTDVSFLRALGPIARRQMTMSVVRESRGLVTDPMDGDPCR